MENYEIIEDLNIELLLLQNTTESLSLTVEAYNDIDNVKLVEHNINIAKYNTGYKEDIIFSKESILDFIKKIITTVVNFVKSMWKKLIKLVKSLRHNISNDTKELDNMIKGLSRSMGNEKMTTKEMVVKIPGFLISNVEKDKLSHYEKFFELVKDVKIETYLTIDKHLIDIVKTLKYRGELDSVYVDIHRSKIIPMYDNNRDMSAILSNIFDHVIHDTNMNKSIIGYTNSNIILLDKTLVETYKIPYQKDNVAIYIPDYIPTLNDHLVYLKNYTIYINKEHKIMDAIDNRMQAIKSAIPKLDESNINNISKVITDITTVIPNLLMSHEVTSYSMYTLYKQTLKSIYNNIE